MHTHTNHRRAVWQRSVDTQHFALSPQGQTRTCLLGKSIGVNINIYCCSNHIRHFSVSLLANARRAPCWPWSHYEKKRIKKEPSAIDPSSSGDDRGEEGYKEEGRGASGTWWVRHEEGRGDKKEWIHSGGSEAEQKDEQMKSDYWKGNQWGEEKPRSPSSWTWCRLCHCSHR